MIFLIGFVIGTILTSLLLMRLIKYFTFVEKLKINERSKRERIVERVGNGGDEETSYRRCHGNVADDDGDGRFIYIFTSSSSALPSSRWVELPL